MKKTLRQRILLTLMNRYMLIFINVILVSIVLAIIINVTAMVLTPENDTDEMIHMCNGIAVILYGFGVAIEFRGTLMRIFNLYPAFASPLQEETDRICNSYGIYFLLLGLVQEILVHLVVMPHRLFHLHGREEYVFTICVFIQTIVTVLLIILTCRLILISRMIRLREERETEPEESQD
ncbi:MAG: hypothetical protein KA369_00505 [Spirochaetes bacterium]|nr:hypothetical protein [Spirochaetota bacterium]